MERDMDLERAAVSGDFGKWWDAYPSSDVAQMERETMTCHGSALWESEEI